MEHIHFGYDPDKIIIHDLNLQAHKGNLVAIVGPTGAGKTTIINLLMRFYDPQSGKIRMEGKDSMEITRKSLRAAYTMVLQDTWLFYMDLFMITSHSAVRTLHMKRSSKQRRQRKSIITL